MGVEDRRNHKRIDLKNHPVSIFKPDGTRVQGYTSNISLYGFKILTDRLSARILSPKTGIITDEDKSAIKLSMTVPHKKGILKINATGRLVYIGVDSDENTKTNHAVGLHIFEYEGGSLDAVSRIINHEVEVISINKK